jgi:type IV pilus assembly protein PilP
MKRLVILLTLAVAACGNPRDSVQDFVANAGAGLHGSVQAPPEAPRYEAATYDAFDLRDPFVAPRKEPAPRPDVQRRDPLEAYSLETLRMVGTVRKDGAMLALVKAPDGQVHQVRAGNRMGLNFGRITAITESAIALVELVPDGAEQATREVVLNLAEAA